MRFEADDLDWAMGELLVLFRRANWVGIYPHELGPELFYEAMSVVNAQPFRIRQRCLWDLLALLTRPLESKKATFDGRRRYGNALAH